MDLGDFIKSEHIILHLKSISKISLLEEMLIPLIKSEGILSNDKENLLDELLNREKKASTAIGNGLAIPHCKTSLVDNIVVSFGLKNEGLDFDALDNNPVKIFILTLSPKKFSSNHIHFLGIISSLFQDENNKKEILKLNSQTEVYDFLITKSKILSS